MSCRHVNLPIGYDFCLTIKEQTRQRNIDWFWTPFGCSIRVFFSFLISTDLFLSSTTAQSWSTACVFQGPWFGSAERGYCMIWQRVKEKGVFIYGVQVGVRATVYVFEVKRGRDAFESAYTSVPVLLPFLVSRKYNFLRFCTAASVFDWHVLSTSPLFSSVWSSTLEECSWKAPDVRHTCS